MPVSLLEHIISQSSASLNGIRAITPAKDLQEYVDNFFIFPCRDLSDSLVYNDGTPMLAFLPEAEGEIELEYNAVTSKFKSGWFSTRSFEKMSVRFSGRVAYLLIVRFKPVSFYRLFGLDAKYLNTCPFWDVQSIFHDSDILLEEMRLCAGGEKKIGIVENCIRGAISVNEKSNRLLDEAIHCIRLHKGTLSIDELKSHLGVNYKWLERNFSATVGMTPKCYSSLQRFIHAYTAFRVQKDLLRITAESGYSDTNHFIKDFKKYTGQTPMQYLHACNVT